MELSQKIRGRFAPSPTGYVHIGSLRTALYNYLFVQKHNGDVLLRLEDTDQKRFVEGSAENLLRVSEAMGIMHHEGPFLKEQIASDEKRTVTPSKNYPAISEIGSHGPYIQSERLDIYKEYAQKLIDAGHAYYCFCDAERLEAMRNEQMQNKQMPKYDRLCLKLSTDEVQKNIDAGLPHVIRFRLPDNEIVKLTDIVRGKVSFPTDSMADAVLMKSDGFPVYHLASVVDDHLMGITHVIRSEEWLASLPLHVLLYKAFGWDAPQFAHLPLILNPDKSKLSKRQGDVAVEDYLAKGYLKEALINFVAFLGWNPGKGETREIFSLEELIETFDLEHVHKAGAIFDVKKLNWLNAQYIKKLSVDELYEKALPFLEKKDFFVHAATERKSADYIKKILTVEQERLNRLDEVGMNNPFFFSDILEYDRELLRWKQNTDEETKVALEKSLATLEGIDESSWNLETLSDSLMQAAGEKKGDLLWPLRVSLTGYKQSPSPFEVAWVIGKQSTLDRIHTALHNLS